MRKTSPQVGKLIDRLLREASGLALKEFEDFLLRRPAAARYRVMMKRVAREPARWAQIKAHLEGETGARIHDANLLGELLKAGFLGRGGDLYSVADPVLAYALS